MAPMVAWRPAGLAQRAGLALAEALRRDRREESLGLDGRPRGPADNLVDGPAVGTIVVRRRVAPVRLRAPGSAAALTVSSFAPWRTCPERLPLGGVVGFEAFQFDVRCPTGLRGTPPHLELLALRPDRAVAVVARCTEHLAPRRGQVARAYDRFLDGDELAPWRAQLRELRERPGGYRHLDAAALVKHALALGRNFPDRPVTLLYMFWEPLDADAFPEFRRHREEVQRFARAIDADGGSKVGFRAASFDDLWREWLGLEEPPDWLADHLWRLRARYAVAIGHGAAPARQ
jgi:hypothetical protein